MVSGAVDAGCMFSGCRESDWTKRSCLSRMSGFEVLKKLREHSDVPVVLLTAKSQSVDKVVGLELGADDYITKPFDTKELMARIKAVLRRCPGQAFTRAQISEAVSTGSHYLASRYIDVHISRLRAKVERNPSSPEIVQTVPSVGYRAARPV